MPKTIRDTHNDDRRVFNVCTGCGQLIYGTTVWKWVKLTEFVDRPSRKPFCTFCAAELDHDRK